MLFKNITILDEDLNVQENCFVETKGDIITYIGKKRPEESSGEEYEGKGRLLMSGFYNAHGHSPMSLMRGYGENMALQDWLNKKIFPFEDMLDGEAVYWGTMLSMAESMKFGIVSTSDMYYFCEDMAKAVADSGMKANISRSIVNPAGEDPEAMDSFREMKSLYSDLHESCGGRIKIDMSLHAEYTSDRRTAEALADYAGKLDTVLHVHVSETESEHRQCIERHGMTPAAYLEDTGLFDIPAIAAHCVYSDDNDLEIFRRRGVTVATNPVSNMKLASGVCNAARVLEKGINLAIGTDSVASNNSLNFMEEMKVLAIGNKGFLKDPAVITPTEALKAATEGGAKAQRRDMCGALREGAKADVVVIDISGANMHPIHSIINNLVYSCSGGDVEMTMVDGKVLYEKGNYRTIDIEKTIYQAEKATKKILERL